MDSEHIVKAYDEELQHLNNTIMEMGGIAEHQIAAALHHETPDDPPDHHMGPYVAVSRMSGAGGGSLAVVDV